MKLHSSAHLVEELGSRQGEAIGRMIPISQIQPNPYQPRQQMGDLTELSASIREKGILEPLIIRRHGERYQIISGERRYQAALQCGLREIPCVERDVDDKETLEIALVENLQRKDLTPFEESEAFGQLVEDYGHTHDALAKRLGKSRTSITESLALNGMPEDIKNLCRLADIASKSLLLHIVRQDSSQKMASQVEAISRGDLTREDTRRMSKRSAKGRPKNYVFRYAPKGGPYRLQLTFRKTSVDKKEVVKVLRDLLKEIERSKG